MLKLSGFLDEKDIFKSIFTNMEQAPVRLVLSNYNESFAFAINYK